MILIIFYCLAVHIVSSVEEKNLWIYFTYSTALFPIELYQLFICNTNDLFGNICGKYIFLGFVLISGTYKDNHFHSIQGKHHEICFSFSKILSTFEKQGT